MSRKSLSKKLRFDIFKRDGFACQYCGAHPSDTITLVIDHIHPVKDGGTNDSDNLITACFACNSGKAAIPLTVVPQSLADRAAMVQEREEQIRAYYEILEARRSRKDEELWGIANVFVERFKDDGIQRSRLASIRMFLERLDYFEVLEAMEIAVDKKYSRTPAFSYFCGICWNKIKRPNGEE